MKTAVGIGVAGEVQDGPFDLRFFNSRTGQAQQGTTATVLNIQKAADQLNKLFIRNRGMGGGKSSANSTVDAKKQKKALRSTENLLKLVKKVCAMLRSKYGGENENGYI